MVVQWTKTTKAVQYLVHHSAFNPSVGSLHFGGQFENDTKLLNKQIAAVDTSIKHSKPNYSPRVFH